MAAAAAPTDFATLGDQLSYWLTHIGQSFKGGYSGSGENGVDIPMPTGTPVYALEGGPIKGKGYYGGGGVVSIRTQPGKVWYYQHLDLIEPSIANGQTTQVQKGQLIGWSGGQSGYGTHPVTDLRYSNNGRGQGWPHIEVGINAPWSGIWGGGEGPNINPLPAIRAVSTSSATTPTGMAATQTTAAPAGPLDWVGQLRQNFGGIFTWLSDPLRILKLVSGFAILGVGVLLFILPNVAGPGLQIAGMATASPELAAVGAAFTRPRGIGARAAEGYGKGHRATRVATETGRQTGVAEQVQAQHQKASEAAKKGWETRRANAGMPKPPKPPSAAASSAPPPGSAEAEDEPVYSPGSKQPIGHFRAGKFVFAGSAPVPPATPRPPAPPKPASFMEQNVARAAQLGNVMPFDPNQLDVAPPIEGRQRLEFIPDVFGLAEGARKELDRLQHPERGG